MTPQEKKQFYSTLCDQQKITGLFMQPWWLEANGRWEVALAIRNQQIIGAMPYGVSRTWGIAKVGMPGLTHHLSIWMDKPPDISDHKWLTREKQIIWLLLDDLPSYGYFSMVYEAGSFNNWLPFHWRGFRQEMRYTFVIPRENFFSEEYQISRNLKRNLREAQHELSIRQDIDLQLLYTLCQETYKRQKLSMPFGPERLQQIDKAVTEHKAGIKLGAYTRSGEIVAVSWLLWDKERAYYFMAGDNAEGRKLGASILLCQEAIRMAFETQQVGVFDFCGSMLEHVADMRRQFGAKAEGLMKIWKARYKWLEIAIAMKG